MDHIEISDLPVEQVQDLSPSEQKRLFGGALMTARSRDTRSVAATLDAEGEFSWDPSGSSL